MNDTYEQKRASAFEERLSDLAVAETDDIGSMRRYMTSEFLEPADVSDVDFVPCEVGFRWHRNRETTPADRVSADTDVLRGKPLGEDLSLGTNVWFRLRGTIPESMAGRPVYLRFAVEPVRHIEDALGNPSRVECLCYRDGEPQQAFDNGHDRLRLTDSAVAGAEYDLLIEAGATPYLGRLDTEEFVLKTADLVAERPEVSDLSRTVSVLNELRTELPEQSVNRNKIRRALVEAAHAFEYTASDLDRTAADVLQDLSGFADALTSELSDHTVTVIGHAHLDLAWLWPWSETVRKTARTATNMLTMMDEDETFRYLGSQPHAYEFLRHNYPEVFERVRERIETDRWQPVGAMWVETDINLASGEAIARQYLYGKRYFRETFDIDPTVTFLPDVFGYSAALPGIARAADCPYFLTRKMSWGEVNEFPYTSFNWRGIDGSTVLAHLPPTTYVGQMTVEEVRKSVRNHDENATHEESVYLMGHGDGGGGPDRAMLDRTDAIETVGSLPDVEYGSLEGFFERLESRQEDLPTWDGELYLETHRGTLTTAAETKRNNRKAEVGLRHAEFRAVLSMIHDGYDYPASRLERAWKITLFNQFHDILPGSSVADVNADATREYAEANDIIDAIHADVSTELGGPPDDTPGSQIAVTNPISWSGADPITVDSGAVDGDPTEAIAPDGTRHPVQRTDEGYLFRPSELPALGTRTYTLRPDTDESTRDTDRADDTGGDTLSVSPSHLENEHLRVTFTDEGAISAVDRRSGRRLFETAGNKLVSYRDHPEESDAWDIEQDLYAVGDALPAPDTTEVIEDGPVRVAVRQVRTFGESRLTQEISLAEGGKRLDFHTTVDWQEDERFLKAHFPVDVRATEATHEIHFGHLTRPTHDNTSWDQARFETAHQRWVDVSEAEFGVSVLNDSKYGVNVDGTDISLSLLRAPEYPDPDVDRGRQEFTYAVYPHEGDFRTGGVIRSAYRLNEPPTTTPVADPVNRRLLTVDADGVVVEAVKRAEDHPDQVVVRLYEAWGRATDATVRPAFAVESALEANLIEDARHELPVTDNTITLDFGAFDIKTVMLTVET